MFIRRLKDCDEFIARDDSILRELQRLENTRSDSTTLAQILRRPEITYTDLPGKDPTLSPEVIKEVEVILKYAGYIDRQKQDVEKHRLLFDNEIPTTLDYDSIPGLRTEARQKLSNIRPETFGQASRISGISPADLNLVLVHVRGRRYPRQAPSTPSPRDSVPD